MHIGTTLVSIGSAALAVVCLASVLARSGGNAAAAAKSPTPRTPAVGSSQSTLTRLGIARWEDYSEAGEEIVLGRTPAGHVGARLHVRGLSVGDHDEVTVTSDSAADGQIVLLHDGSTRGQGSAALRALLAAAYADVRTGARAGAEVSAARIGCNESHTFGAWFFGTSVFRLQNQTRAGSAIQVRFDPPLSQSPSRVDSLLEVAGGLAAVPVTVSYVGWYDAAGHLHEAAGAPDACSGAPALRVTAQ